MRAGDRSTARRELARAEELLPELADYSLLHGARLAAEDGDLATARVKYDALLGEHEDSIWLASAAIERAELDLAAGDSQAALALFDRAAGSAGTSAAGSGAGTVGAPADPTTLDAARLGRARALAALGRNREAYAVADELRGAPGKAGHEARALGERLEGRGASELGLTDGELDLRAARARLREGRLAEAATRLAQLLEGGRPERPQALLTLGRIRARQGDGEAARRAWQEASRESPDASVAATALFESGRLAWNRNDDDAAVLDFQALLSRFPEHERALDAATALARIAESRAEFGLAAQRYEAATLHAAGRTEAKELRWRSGMARLLAGDPDGAARWLESQDDDEALYWRARALAAAGDRTGARSLHDRLRTRAPQSYLAWWLDGRGEADPAPEPALDQPTAGAAGAGATATFAATRPAVPPATPPSKPTVESDDGRAPPPAGPTAAHLVRGDLLRSLSLPAQAAREYAAAEAASAPTRQLLERYRSVAAYPAMIRLARRLDERGEPEVEGHLYPLAFRAELERAAAQAGLDPLLLAALARQESLFDPAARSSAGARGLLQLMPATANALAGGPLAESTLETPSTNAELGARYLRRMLDRHDGRLILAIAAYNAGPEAVARWQARTLGRPGDEFVELIGFRETRQYVKAVLRNYSFYRALHGKPGAPAPRLY